MTTTPTPTRRATGLRSFRPDRLNLKLADFVTGAPKAPKACDWTPAVRQPWGMLGNDDAGDCFLAAEGHATQTWTANVGTESIVTTGQVLAAYSALTGYDPAKTRPDGSNPTDKGTDPMAGMRAWRHTDAAHVGQPVLAFAQVSLSDPNLVRLAIEWFGGVLLGVNLPVSAQRQVEAHKAWIPGRGASGQPGGWGGHAIWTPAYDGKDLTPITWGQPQFMSWAFLAKYGMVGFAPVSPLWLNAAGRTPSHLDKAGLLAAVAKVTSH